MYLPVWLIVIIVVVVFYIYRSNKEKSGSFLHKPNVDDIEKGVDFQKDQIFSLEHFDSPHFIDLQDAFDTMEINYLRLKQRFSHTPEKFLEIAEDWYKYTEALREMKFARVMLDVDMSEDAFDNMHERGKEPVIIRQEVEKKFKTLLGEDWLELPPDYFKRMETMKEPDKKTKQKLGLRDDWKYYYSDSPNLYKLEKERKKEEEKQKVKKESKK